MQKKRNANLEVLRIIMICCVALYHVVLYSGIFSAEYETGSMISLIPASLGGIGADYVFWGISAYFFITLRPEHNVSKFLTTAVHAAVLYAIKMIALGVIFRGVDLKGTVCWDFFYKGAWWYIYAYLFMLLVYPLLNLALDRMSTVTMTIVTILLGCLVGYNSLGMRTNFINDLIAFIFAYFLMAIVVRLWGTRIAEGSSGIKWPAAVAVGSAVLIVALGYLVCSRSYPDTDAALDALKPYVTKYSLPHVFLGFALILLVMNMKMQSNRIIEILAASVMDIFLLHETVLAALWQAGFLNHDTITAGGMVFAGRTAIYIALAVVVGVVVSTLYRKLIGPPVAKIVRKILQHFHIAR